MSKNTMELDQLIRKRAREAYDRRVNEAWNDFVKQAHPEQSRGSYSSALHDLGRKMIEALKIEQTPKVEQTAVEDFLKKFEEFGEQLTQLENVAHEH